MGIEGRDERQQEGAMSCHLAWLSLGRVPPIGATAAARPALPPPALRLRTPPGGLGLALGIGFLRSCSNEVLFLGFRI